VALLHFDAVPGDIAGNRGRIEAAIEEAAGHGANWVVTPELAESGYNFAKVIGTTWIKPYPGPWIDRLTAIARTRRVALFIGFVEKDAASGKLYNSVAVIDRQGRLLGTYRKQIVHGAAESWSTPGSLSVAFNVDGVRVGVLICADAYKAEFAGQYAQQGSDLLLSPANWPPVAGMEPRPYWEARTRETRLPLVISNRTGKEPGIDFSDGQSAVVVHDQPLLTFSSTGSRIFYIDWDGMNGFAAVRP
jgi:predicted amidohydrolase